jgi:hypothetical protein
MKDTRGGERMKFWRKLSPESPNKLYRPSKVFSPPNETKKETKEKKEYFYCDES